MFMQINVYIELKLEMERVFWRNSPVVRYKNHYTI